MKAYATLGAAALVSASVLTASPAPAAQCAFDSPLPFGPPTIPFTCPDPVPGPEGPQGQAGLDGQDGTDGAAGVNGRDGRDGINGRDFDLDKALAMSAAISTPVWLSDSENFAISGGVGFAEGETAFGATGIMRLDKNWSAYAGGAVGSGDWVGRAGARVGW